MRSSLIAIALLAACQTPEPSHPSSPAIARADGGPAQNPAAGPPAPRASQSPPAAAFFVPPLPPDAAVTRWQHFCWTGFEALQHLDEAGAQGWELISVSVAATSDVAVPNSVAPNRIRSTYISGSQLWLVCFKRPYAATRPGAK